jgi:glycosyltransferase involved in cell wall biosynthesis
MKIGIDAREFLSDQITGIGRFLLQFLKYATTSSPSHEYVLFCNQKTHVPLEHPEVKKIIIPEKITPIWDQILLPLNVAREKIDVFLAPYLKVPFFLSTNMVLIIFDTIPLLFPEDFGVLKRLYFKLMCGLAAKRATSIITISENSRDDIVKFFKLPSEKINVVPLGVEGRFMSPEVRTEEVRKKYSLPQKFILYVGNLSPHKNIQGLIEAYGTLPFKLRGQYKLVLVSSKCDKYFPFVDKISKEMQLTRDLMFTDFIEDKDLPAVYHMSTLFVFPSFYEGFGLPPLEAMACGCPVVSSNTSSIPEVLGSAALFFNPYNVEEMAAVIRRMLEDENLRNMYRSKGLERASLFSPEKMTNRILDVVELIQASKDV